MKTIYDKVSIWLMFKRQKSFVISSMSQTFLTTRPWMPQCWCRVQH